MRTTAQPAGEVSTIGTTRAFYEALARGCDSDVEQIEVALAHLADLELDQDTLDGFQSAQDDARHAAARCRATVAVLDARQGQMEEAVAATPDAARTEFYQEAAAHPYRRGAAQSAPAGQRRDDTSPEETEMAEAAPSDRETTATSDAPASTDEVTPPAAEPVRAGYYRCDRCSYVVGPQPQAPAGCPNCVTRDASFSPTEIFYPPRPSDEAIEQDTRDVEAAIRAAYARVARHRGEIVPLADVRAALPAALDRETVDAALTKLAGHADVHVEPRADQKQANPANQQAAVHIGGSYEHTLSIEGGRPSMAATLQRIQATSRVQAESMLAPLNDSEVAYLAERMNVDTSGAPAAVRRRVAEQAAANRQAWLADAHQGVADGKLLYRADHEPDWVASWTDTDRQAAREAAARLLERADRQPSWAYIRERATRWS